MAKEPCPVLLSVTDVIGATLIDHGNTVAVQLETPEGNKVAFVMPKAVASTLADEIRIALGAEASANPRSELAGLFLRALLLPCDCAVQRRAVSLNLRGDESWTTPPSYGASSRRGPFFLCGLGVRLSALLDPLPLKTLVALEGEC